LQPIDFFVSVSSKSLSNWFV